MSSETFRLSEKCHSFRQKQVYTKDNSPVSKGTIDLSTEASPIPKIAAKDDTWKLAMEEKMNTLLAHIADISSKSTKDVIVAPPVPSAVSVHSVGGTNSVASAVKEIVSVFPLPSAVSVVNTAIDTVPGASTVIRTIDESIPIADASKTNEESAVHPTVDESIPITDASKANEESVSVASSKQKKSSATRKTSVTSVTDPNTSSARVTRGSKRKAPEDDGIVDK